MSVRQDLDLLKQFDCVSRYSYEEPCLLVVVDDKEYNVIIPDEYPNGEATVFGERQEVLRPGRIDEIMNQILAMHRSRTVSFDEAPEPVMDVVDSSEVRKEVQLYQKNFGEGSAEWKSAELFDTVSFQVPLNLDNNTAVAWGATPHLSMTITLKFETKYFTEQRLPPRVDVSQAGERFPLGQQLARVLQEYFRCHWKSAGWEPPLMPTWAVLPRQQKQSKPVQSSKRHGKKPQLKEHQQAIQEKLVEMGFSNEQASQAASQGDTIEEALEAVESNRGEGAEELPPVVDAVSMFGKAEATIYDSDSDINKLVPYDPSMGFLGHLRQYILKRIPTMSSYCVLCDKPHLFGTNMLRPAVCSRDVCVFAFQELGCGSDSAESVATDAGVVDLLIKLFVLAATSSRMKDVLDPFPAVPDPQNRSHMLLDPAKPNFETLKEVLQHFPSVEEIIGSDNLMRLRETLERKHRAAYPLVEWAINSNRSVLIKLAAGRGLPSMSTPHQFILLQAPPEKQRVFVERKQKYGTKFAFHGSRAENWHSILRNGLKNMSGTSMQLNGAAHGSGIYFACESATSFGYSSSGSVSGGHSHNTNLINPENMVCLALCEIVNHKINVHGEYCWTVEDEGNVMTRFLFVFSEAPSNPPSTKDSNFLGEVRTAMENYHLE